MVRLTFCCIRQKVGLGRAMAQAVSRRPLMAESRVRTRVNPCGIFGGQSGTGAGFSPSSSAFPCQYHSIVSLYTHVSSGERTVCPLVAAVQRRSLTHRNLQVGFNSVYLITLL
jgi:hypothetical protein